MSRRATRPDEFVPLSERVLMLMVFRAAAALTVGAIAATAHGDVQRNWLLIAGYLTVTGAGSLPVLTARRRLTLHAFSVNLLLDGVFLQGELAWGPRSELVVIVVTAYLAVVCLLASFRTGLKVALWHSLLVFLLYQAARTHQLTGLPGRLSHQGQTLAYLAALWLTVFVVAQFAALNERELRRRRYDAEALYELANSLVGTDELAGIRAAVVAFARDELGARRCAWLTRDPAGWAVALGHGLAGEVEPGAGPSALLAGGSGPRVVYSLTGEDAWLAGLFPGARRLIALPIPHSADWVVLEHPGRGTRLERRVVNTARQAGMAASLACSRAAMIARLRSDASTDALTGCANRGRFDSVIGRLAADADGPVSLLLVDIDHFKRVNDVHGHVVGDDVLRAVADALRLAARDTDLVARYGGEEFAIVMRNTRSAAAVEVAEWIRRRVATDVHRVPVTVSIGVATAIPGSDGTGNAARLVSRADAALYAAKSAGRDRVVAARPQRRLSPGPSRFNRAEGHLSHPNPGPAAYPLSQGADSRTEPA